MTKFFLVAGVSPPPRSHSEVNTSKHRTTTDDAPKPTHQAASKPAWLLALEIVTGVMVGSLVLIALITAFQRCNSKPSLIIPWKKSNSEKEHMTVFIGWDP